MSIWDELAKPFDPQKLKWRIQNLSKDKTSAIVVAYCNLRDYERRLDKVVGPENWSSDCEISTSETHASVRVNITINGITKSQVGEEIIKYGDDINSEAFTTAYAQAFKRCCSQFSLGRYLYRLEDIWVDVDTNNPFDRDCTNNYNGQNYGFDRPDLPKFAIPGNGVKTGQSGGDTSRSSSSPQTTSNNQQQSQSSSSNKNSNSSNSSNNDFDVETDSDGNPVLNFGKFDGDSISEVPGWYVDYMTDFDDDDGWDEWIELAENERARRVNSLRQELKAYCDELDLDPEVIKATCQESYGVDDTKSMELSDLNDIKDHLEELIEEGNSPTINGTNELVMD